jgi:ornithine cyclodeaminase/alanine dehydrogenase-like protein (mu-crystallin family)
MKKNQCLYLSRADVEQSAPGMDEIINLLEKAFTEKGKGHVEMPPKPGIHPKKDAFIHAMPASIPALRSAGIKWVSGFPENPEKGLPYICGLMILNDFDTGIPNCVMDCTWVTGARTGAATALAAKYLARPDSKTVGILACGVQGRTNLEALSVLFPLERVYAYDILPKNQKAFVEEMSRKHGINIIPVEAPREAVERSDIVITSGPIFKHPSPTISAGWLQPGAFASAIDYDSYWQPEAIKEVDLFITDDLAQMAYCRTIGYFQNTPQPDSDLGEIAAGLKPGRTGPDQRTMTMNLGLALDDMAVGPEIYRRAKKQGIGTWLAL